MLTLVLAVFGALFAVSYVALALRIVPNALARVWFGVTLVSCFLTWFVLVYPIYALNLAGVAPKAFMEAAGIIVGSFMMRVTRWLNPQMRVRGYYNTTQFPQVPAAAHIMCNHTSFWDSLNYSCELPLLQAPSKKTLMKASLASMPIAGMLFFKVMGEFPVYFAGEGEHDFGVDREKQEQVSRDINAWLASGNGITYCPEGRINHEPDVVQALRYGMLKTLAESGHPIFVFTQWQNHVFWPKGAPIGGCAADISVTLGEYKYKGPGGKPPRNDKGELDVAAFAADLRDFMQSEVDRLKALAGIPSAAKKNN
jgi:1-acyl-sn-glycerol-3-phosphate acyltransferase